jgi:hypothetical protein
MRPPRLPWTAEELTQLRELAGTMTAAAIGARLGRSRWGVLGKIEGLGLPGAPDGSPLRFTAAEDKAIRAGVKAGKPPGEIAAQIGRSRHAVWSRARALNGPAVSPWYWTPEQNAMLIDAAGALTAKELAKKVRRSAKAVRSQAEALGVTLMRWKPEEMHGYWAPEAEARLRALAPTHTPTQASVALGRTDRSVRIKAAKMGLRMRDGRMRLGSAARARGPAKRQKVAKPIELVRARPKPVAQEVPCIEFCPECHAPVSNWAQHYERMGHRRRA